MNDMHACCAVRASAMPKAELTKIKLTESVDIHSIGDARAFFVEAFRSGRGVEIDLADVTGVDLTLVQLIESARKTAAQRSLQISLATPAAGAVLEILQRGGFLTGDPGQSAFWTAGQGS